MTDIRDSLSASSFDSPELTLQSTPRIIYELKGEYNRLVAELYMDNRVYLLGSVSLNKKDYRYFFKIVVAPQWIVDRKGKNTHFHMYSAVNVEIVQNIGHLQWIFKTSPKISWGRGRWHFRLSGAGFEFHDEIGITFDNNELFAFKNAGSYNALIFALKGSASFDIFPFLSFGLEPSYRGGLVWNGRDRYSMTEVTFSLFLQSNLKITENWTLSLRGSGEFTYYNSFLNDREPLPGESIFRLSMILSH